jgi:hypothetical protein
VSCIRSHQYRSVGRREVIAAAERSPAPALAALGAGNRDAAQILVAATAAERLIYVPALCLVAAEAERTGLAEHIGSLAAVEIEGLDVDAVGLLT